MNKMSSRFLFATGLLLGALFAISLQAEPEKSLDPSGDWREDYAHSMGVAALHYAYPWLRMAEVRHRWAVSDVDFPAVQPNHGLNSFWHASRLTDHNWQEGGAPNNDTAYSVAWLLVDEEPMILSMPPIDRYFTFEFSGFDSDNFAFVGELRQGRSGGHYALLPKGWKGELPSGVKPVSEVPTPWVMVVGRTYVGGHDDLPVVHELQKQYKITPLSQWGQATVTVPKPAVFAPYVTESDPLAIWKTINRAMTENPPVESEQKIIALFSELNIGPGLDVTQLDEASQRGLARAAEDGLAQIKHLHLSGAGKQIRSSNGWTYSNSLGRAGVAGDFLLRTVYQSYAGIVANDPEEAIYYGGYVGSDGKPFHGSKSYRVHLPKGAEPNARAFWSISLYDDKGNMVDNEIGRYSIGDRTPDLVRGKDGSLGIAIQHKAPANHTANWLPAPEGAFWLILRAYQPGSTLLDGSWEPPIVTVVD